MKLNAGCTLTYHIKHPTTIIAMLRPKSDETQFIQEEKFVITPHSPVIEYTDNFGNLCQRSVLQRGEVTLSANVIAKVSGSIDVDLNAEYIFVEQLPHEVLQFLIASRYCQSDLLEISTLALSVIPRRKSAYVQVAAIRDWLHQNISYQYNTTNSTTTALDVLHKRVGVCRDYSHLGIALCRSLSIPARMVVGYLHNLKNMDLHAWFEAFVGGRWFTFDAVQPQPDGGRIVIGYGRDAADVAFITQFGDGTLQTMEVWAEEISDED